MKYLVFLLLVPFHILGQSSVDNFSTTQEYDVADTVIDHWMVSVKTDLVVVTQDSLVTRLIIREKNTEDPFEISRSTKDLDSNYLNNKFITDSERFNKLVQIFVDPNFSQKDGGKIILSVYKKTAGKKILSMFIERTLPL